MKTDRRSFIRLLAAGGGALVLGVRFGDASEGLPKRFEPNAWLSIGGDGTVVVRVGKTEMGQGVRTSLPMIVAEELDVPLHSVRLEQASPSPEFRRLGTGGSSSIMSLWNPLRQAGATARMMLVAAAAARWNLDPAKLTTRDGMVIDPGSDRRLGYGELAPAASQQPVPEKPSLKDRKSFRIIGHAAARIDGPDIVCGRARYGLDVRVPGMLRAVVARAPRFGSTVVSFDRDAAKNVANVVDVVQIPSGVAVVATNTWAAMRGRDALNVIWSESPHASFDDREHRAALQRAVETPGITIRKDGEGRTAFDKVSRRMDATYLYPFAAHASVEPVNCTALVDGHKATIWSPTQAPNTVQTAAAEILGIPESAITVHVTLVGGGFGRRLGVDFDREAVEVARRVKGKPVQLVWSREDDMRHGYFQAASAHRLSAGFDEKGSVVAWEHRKASTPHNARSKPTAKELSDPEYLSDSAWGVSDTPYVMPSAEMSYAVVDAPVPIGPWRAVFSPSSVFARECFIDEIAQETKQDPIRLRLALLNPDNRLRRVLEEVALRSGWPKTAAGGAARGVAANVFHTGTSIAYIVDVSLKKRPFKIERVVCAVDCGVAVNPLGVAQQVESGILWSLSNMKSGISMRNGAVVETNYADFPVAMIEDTPPVIETHIVESSDERPHGLGEPTVCPFAPAVVNALSRLTGRRIRELPVNHDFKIQA
ncbi:MAG TPA: molybdopterin cofactor-binding domain-containing protein [Thermoanaerobaculia bacterium]|nr:molybdopterin cofactor-binding domain-containing protein [Thermoanaerobaculia bacterium]